jgi:AcrR family transcriptional regulator
MRSRFLAAAKEVFEEKGYVDARIADIAERAGVSHGLVYHYFESKQDVFRELATATDQELIDTMEVILDRSSSATLEERLHEAIRLNFERYRRDARLMTVMEEVSRYDDDVNAARTKLRRDEYARLTRAIERLQQRGLADRRLDPTIAATAMGAMAFRFAESWFVKGDLDCDFDRGVDQFTTLVLNLLGAEQARDPTEERRTS